MNKLQEIWLSIENFPNYEISNLGNVRNKVSGKLKSKCIIRGYYYVDLHYKGKRKNSRLARVVANAFLPNIKNKEQVNHIDFNRFNDCVDNLEWNTRSENQRHKIRFHKENGIYVSPKGNNKFSRDIIDSIFSLKNIDGLLNKEISKITGVSMPSISLILNGKRRINQ